MKTTDGVSTVTRTPRAAELLKKIEDSVAGAVGLNTERGDRLTVQNIAFEEPLAEEVVAPTMLQQWQPQLWEGSRIGAVLLVAALAFFFFVRPVTRRLSVVAPTVVTVTGGDPRQAGQRVRTVAEMENEIEAQLDAAAALQAGENRRLPVLTRRVAETSQREPEHVAKVLRSWMAEEER
jgi:flagellar M-ring protein FliF